VAVFESRRGKIINAEFTRKGDASLVTIGARITLVSEGERLGVIGLWERLPKRPDLDLKIENRLNFAGHLSNVIRGGSSYHQFARSKPS